MISDQVVHSLQRSHGWTREFINDLVPYYMATLTHMSKGHATPVFDIVDEIWHAHILCTRDYADFCTIQFGRFIHHERFEETSEYTEHRGETDFFRDYGLSLRVLNDICAKRHSGQQLRQARCGAGEPPRRSAPQGKTLNALPIARCGAPEPPDSRPQSPTVAISSQQALAIARCGEPNTPPGNDRKPVHEAV